MKEQNRKKEERKKWNYMILRSFERVKELRNFERTKGMKNLGEVKNFGVRLRYIDGFGIWRKNLGIKF